MDNPASFRVPALTALTQLHGSKQNLAGGDRIGGVLRESSLNIFHKEWKKGVGKERNEENTVCTWQKYFIHDHQSKRWNKLCLDEDTNAFFRLW